jgi:hypothetical protein
MHVDRRTPRRTPRQALAALFALPLAAFAAGSAGAQQPRALPAPDATFEEPFSMLTIGTVRELRDGRVVVADPRDKILQVVDFRAQRAMKVGREGSGPAEYGMPMRLLTAPGDTTFLFDPLNQRYLPILPDGKPGATFRVEFAPARQQGPGGGMMRMGLETPRAADARGRLYFESAPITMGPDGPRAADSAAVTRFDRATQKLDTLAWIALPKGNAQVSGSQGNMSVMIGQANPLAPRDEWTVFPDGRVAIVRAEPYRVDWILANGTRQSGAAIRHTPIRMGDAEKREEEVTRNRERQNQMMMTVEMGPGGTQRRAQMGPGPNAPPLEPRTDWPAVKPPFRPGLASVLARPNGELWVRRTEAAGAKGTLYDVIDAKGAVTHQVRVGEGLTVVGFGNGTVYTTKSDEDDLRYLQRHRMP